MPTCSAKILLVLNCGHLLLEVTTLPIEPLLLLNLFLYNLLENISTIVPIHGTH